MIGGDVYDVCNVAGRRFELVRDGISGASDARRETLPRRRGDSGMIGFSFGLVDDRRSRVGCSK